MKSYLSTPRLARLFGVNVQTVLKYICSGELPAAKVGRRYVVSGDDVDTFIEARRESRKLETADAAKGGKSEPVEEAQ